MVDLHRQIFNAKLQEHMANKAKSMTLLFESEYAQALECLGIYGTLDVGSEERKKAAPTARKFELLTCGGDQELAVAAAEAENEHPDQQADERRNTLQAAAAPAELGAAGANAWGRTPRQSGEANKAMVELQGEWNPTLTALRDAMAQLHPTLLYFICPAVDTGDGNSGDLSLGSLRLGDGNMEAGGVATHEEIAECTCSGGNTC
eukprot:jgi/Tetstr1/443661/TSEL_031653.t1